MARIQPTMLQQLSAVRDHLINDSNNDLRQSIRKALVEDPELGANMIIDFAREKGIELEATPGQVIDQINAIQEDDFDIELTQEMLSSVSGGISGGKDKLDKFNSFLGLSAKLGTISSEDLGTECRGMGLDRLGTNN